MGIGFYGLVFGLSSVARERLRPLHLLWLARLLVARVHAPVCICCG